MSTGTQTEVVMPQMGVSVSEGTITKWAKQVGEEIAADETLLEISTDKVDTEVPSPASGVVTEILVQDGETVEVGTKLAVIAPAGAEAPAPEAEAEPEAESVPEPATAQAAAARALQPRAPVQPARERPARERRPRPRPVRSPQAWFRRRPSRPPAPGSAAAPPSPGSAPRCRPCRSRSRAAPRPPRPARPPA